MKMGRRVRCAIAALGILLGVGSCATPGPPPSHFASLLSRLPDTRYRATMVSIEAGEDSYPLAVILDPEGGERLSILPLSSAEVDTQKLGQFDRKKLIARLDGMEAAGIGGPAFRYAGRYSKWRLRPVVRFGGLVGHLMSVDPGLRFSLRRGTSGRVFTLVLRPSDAFLEEVQDGG